MAVTLSRQLRKIVRGCMSGREDFLGEMSTEGYRPTEMVDPIAGLQACSGYNNICAILVNAQTHTHTHEQTAFDRLYY